VTNALCELDVEDKPAQRAPRKVGTKRRSRPAFDGARRAIAALFSTGVPPQAEVPNAILYRRVDNWLKANKLPGVSEEHDSKGCWPAKIAQQPYRGSNSRIAVLAAYTAALPTLLIDSHDCSMRSRFTAVLGVCERTATNGSSSARK
jgi:hypothetical protein